MKPLNPHLSATEWETALRASERLWPEPALAPEVPPEAELEKYISVGPLAFRPVWLRQQIEESAACQRALEDLRLRHRLSARAPVKSALEAAGFRISGGPASSALSPRKDQTGLILLGDLRRSSGQVFIFSEGIRKVRQTFRPLLVAPVAGPFLEVEQEFWRVVVCTPAELWPEEHFADDEILVRSLAGCDYVAHLWLEYPMSVVQIADKVGEITSGGLDNLFLARAVRDEGIPLGFDPMPDRLTVDHDEQEPLIAGCRLDPVADAAIFCERQQLHECAGWLSATLDTHIEREVWQMTGWYTANETVQESTHSVRAERAWDLCIEAGATISGGDSSQCLEWIGPLNTFHILLVGPPSLLACRNFRAACLLAPEPDGEDGQACRAQWSLSAEFSHLVGRRFAVFCPSDGRLLGSGNVRTQGTGLPLLAELEEALWRDFDGVTAHQLILLFPEHW